jgi:hypothetical protein
VSATVTDHEKLRDETPTTYYEEVLKLPGYGEAPNRCRPMKPVGFCEEGHTVLGRSSCGTRYCPDHWRDWLEDALVPMVARLAAYRQVAEGAEKRLSHVVASPPQDRRYSVREVWDTRSDAYDAFEAAGVRGGVCVTHPYRTTDEADEMYATVAEHGDLDEDTGRWKFLRELTEDWEELAGYAEASPHYHSLAAGEDIDGSRAPDGWVVERIRSLQAFHPRDTEAYRDMVAPAYYILTHGAVQDGRATTTYFGEIHPNSFDPEEELTAAMWSRIQIEAEKAVKEEPGEDGEVSGHGPDECPRDGCRACVVDVLYLREYLDDEDFVSRVLAHRDGRARLAQLRGMIAWWEERTDRPPPRASKSERRMLEWLQERGEVFTPEPAQVSLTTSVMG